MANVSVYSLLFQFTCIPLGVKLSLIYFSGIVVVISFFVQWEMVGNGKLQETFLQ